MCAPASSLIPSRSAAPRRLAPPRPGCSPCPRDASFLQMVLLQGSLGAAPGLRIAPSLKEAVEGQDHQGAQDVHDPVPQLHLAHTAQADCGWREFSCITSQFMQLSSVTITPSEWGL